MVEEISSDTDNSISDELYEEILKNTDKKNYVNYAERLLLKTMVALVKSGHAMFLFLQDDETREYWTRIVNQAKLTVKRRKEAWDKYNIKVVAYNRLSPEERKILKLRKPTPPRD